MDHMHGGVPRFRERYVEAVRSLRIPIVDSEPGRCVFYLIFPPGKCEKTSWDTPQFKAGPRVRIRGHYTPYVEISSFGPSRAVLVSRQTIQQL